MAGKFLHAVNLEEEREALLNCIEGYKYFLSNPNTYFYEKAYYEGIILGLQSRLASLENAPLDKEGRILLKFAISSKQK